MQYHFFDEDNDHIGSIEATDADEAQRLVKATFCSGNHGADVADELISDDYDTDYMELKLYAFVRDLPIQDWVEEARGAIPSEQEHAEEDEKLNFERARKTYFELRDKYEDDPSISKG